MFIPWTFGSDIGQASLLHLTKQKPRHINYCMSKYVYEENVKIVKLI